VLSDAPPPTPRGAHARSLFAPLGPTYDRTAAVLSFGQDPYWKRFLVAKAVEAGAGALGPESRTLDVATGTAAVAIDLARRTGAQVTGLDQSPEMLAAGRARVAAAGLDGRVELVEGRAQALPWPDATFDAVTVTYLLRYVDDPAAQVRELVRVARPGAPVASLEFGLPAGVWRPLWELYVRAVLPAAGRLLSPAWGEVGGFLGGSIRGWYREHPLQEQLGWWRAAGVADVRARPLSVGGGVVVWGTRSG
jgi:demethylmenaquinone methyltransferase/2-methoxy-6-polyprenyl-1,4-benzoquinol methylase